MLLLVSNVQPIFSYTHKKLDSYFKLRSFKDGNKQIRNIAISYLTTIGETKLSFPKIVLYCNKMIHQTTWWFVFKNIKYFKNIYEYV